MERSKALLEAIKKYNIQDKQYRESKLKGTVFNDHLLIEWQEAIKGIFKSLNPQVDASGLLYELSLTSYRGVIEDLSSADFITYQFKSLNIEIPKSIAECIDEVKLRNSFTEKFISKKEYQWNNEKVQEFKQIIKSELAEKSFDKESEQIYLKRKFSKALVQIEKLEVEFSSEYQYPLNTFLEDGEFTLINDEFNRFFFYCQLHKRTIKAFHPIVKSLEYYVSLKNELNQLKHLITLPQNQNKEHQGQGNLFPLVFKDEFGYRLFERLHENNKDSDTPLADYSFIYRMMWEEDSLLLDHQKPEVFKKWLGKEPFNIVLGSKFKRLVDCSPKSKKAEYYFTKELVRIQMNEQNNS